MNIQRKLHYFIKKELTPYNITVFCIGILFIIADIVYFSMNSFRLQQLLINNQFEFLFLLLTGFFLYGFKYDILNVPVTFNAFIIYTSNIVLYIDKNMENGQLNFNSHVIVLIVFFIFTYFLIQLLLYIVFRKITINKAAIILVRMILWTTEIVVFNFFIYKLHIDMAALHLRDVLWLLMLVVIHNLIKIMFQLFERSLQRKYMDFAQMAVSFVMTDSIFMLFAILLGSIYSKIAILHLSFFIAFLAIVISIVRYITNKNSQNLAFFKIISFIDRRGAKDVFVPEYPFYPSEKADLSFVFRNEIYYLDFVMIKFDNPESAAQFVSSRSIIRSSIFCFLDSKNDTVCSILPDTKYDYRKQIARLQADLEKKFEQGWTIAHCGVRKRFWHLIDTEYIFKVLNHKLNPIRLSKSAVKPTKEIIEVDQKYIFS
ncbi:MAG: hypothetical protein J6W76_04775 [Spirochaetales bacterium]|nr:hypothetical protein [Spirochaetales bacterium]